MDVNKVTSSIQRTKIVSNVKLMDVNHVPKYQLVVELQQPSNGPVKNVNLANIFSHKLMQMVFSSEIVHTTVHQEPDINNTYL
jgi:hypothetical protein